MEQPIDKVPVMERRQIVSRRKLEGKSNRSIARELMVDEGTIRRDLDFLATPAAERPASRRVGRKEVRKRAITSLPKLDNATQRSPTTVPVYSPGDPTSLKQQKLRTVRALKAWYLKEKLSPRDAEEIVHEAGKLLWNGGRGVRGIPLPKEVPYRLVPLCRPIEPPTDDLQHVSYHAAWLARGLVSCLPSEESAREEVLQELSTWARELPWR